MAAVTGVGFLIKVNTGTTASPVYTTVAGQRSATLDLSVDEADTTSKTSSGWHEGLPTIRSWSIDGDGLILETDTGMVLLETCYMNNTQVYVQVYTPAAHTYTGLATLTDFSYDASYDSEATVSYTLTGSGALTKV